MSDDRGAGDADPTRRNRLDEEASPYLRQHADNPVHWQPWDDRAFAAARERDVPVFLSIGYSACHWCHVMEEESFSDPEIAELLNDNFVPVKVDREERPDVDSVYMTVCQLVSGRGGWPLSAFLTPDGDPFYVGTYFPKESKRGQPGFRQLLEDVAASWSDPDQRTEIEERAEQWASAAADELESVPDQPGEPDDDLLIDAAEAAVRAADREFGGFGRGQKFPHPGRIHLLLRAHHRTGRDEFRAVAVETLDAMADGGLYDHLGDGFHRYATDREWVVPHFEKMLYDNAELPRAYLAGYRATGDDRYATVARETFAFLDRELSHPDGGFYSTLDARSPPPPDRADEDGSDTEQPDDPDAHAGEEGAFYVWTPDGVRAAVGDDLDADLFCDRYGVDEPGNFEGTTVLTRHASVAELADAYDLAESEVEERLERAREAAVEARAERPRPARDEKIIAGWNGLAVRALAEGALALEDDAHADRAADALSFVREHLWDADDSRLARRYKDGDVAGRGYLEDYAFLAAGALDCYGATADPDHLDFALALGEVIVEEFWDEEDGTLYFTPASGERLVARPQELDDSSTPSSAGVAAQTLARLDQFRPDDEFGAVAERVVETHAAALEEAPLRRSSLVLAADDLARGVLEFTVVADEIPAAWRARLAESYLPGLLLAPRPSGDDALDAWLDRLGLDEAPPVWAGRGTDGGEPTVYACRRACSPPLTEIDDAIEWTEKL